MSSRILKCFVLTALLVVSAPTHAIEILGFELTKTKRSEFLDKNQNNSSLQRIPATDTYTKHGYSIDAPKSNAFPAPERAAFMFDPEDRLCAVLLQFSMDQYDVLIREAKAKYKLIGEDNAKNGRREALFGSGTHRVAFASDPSRRTMYVMYMDEGFNKDNNARIRAHGFRPKFE